MGQNLEVDHGVFDVGLAQAGACFAADQQHLF